MLAHLILDRYLRAVLRRSLREGNPQGVNWGSQANSWRSQQPSPAITAGAMGACPAPLPPMRTASQLPSRATTVLTGSRNCALLPGRTVATARGASQQLVLGVAGFGGAMFGTQRTVGTQRTGPCFTGPGSTASGRPEGRGTQSPGFGFRLKRKAPAAAASMGTLGASFMSVTDDEEGYQQMACTAAQKRGRAGAVQEQHEHTKRQKTTAAAGAGGAFGPLGMGMGSQVTQAACGFGSQPGPLWANGQLPASQVTVEA